MRVRLTNEQTGATFEGDATYPPVVGKPFRVVDDANPDLRVTTTDVDADLGNGRFRTAVGNVYRVELIGTETLLISRRLERA